MRSLLSRFISNRALQGAGRLTLATIIGQSCLLLASPILTRLYSPEDFGVLAVFASVIGIVSVFATLRYHLALPVALDQLSALSLAVGSIVLTLLAGAVVGLLAIAGLGVLFSNGPTAINTIPPGYYAVGVISIGLFQVVSHWSIRDRNYSGLARARIVQAVSAVSAQVILGLLVAGPMGLLTGQVLGQGMGMFRLAREAVKDQISIIRKVTPLTVVQALNAYRRYPLYSAPAALLTNTNLQLLPLILAAAYSPELVGLYALGARLIKAPLQILGNSVSQIYLAELGARIAKSPKRLAQLFRRTTFSLAAIGAPPLLLLALFAPTIFELIFGLEWRQAGQYTRLLVPMYLVQFIVSPISQTLNALQRQRVLTYISAAQTGILIVLFVTSFVRPVSVEVVLIFYSLTMAFTYVVVGLISHRAIRVWDHQLTLKSH